MKVIPVLDLLNGITVQAIAGRRSEYRPIRSHLTDSVDPSVVLRQLTPVCQSQMAYIADLDAIMGREPNRCTLAELSRMDLSLLVDAGIQSPEDAQELFDLGIHSVVVALESLPGPQAARHLLAQFDPATLVLSLDLRSGSPIAQYPDWRRSPPADLMQEFAAMGYRRWIILDLASVGTAQGVSTRALCQRLRDLQPDDEIITGGGICSAADLHDLAAIEVDGVLVASALHNGSLTRSDILAVSA